VADQTEQGIVDKAKAAARKVNPLTVAADAAQAPLKKRTAAPRNAEGLLKGRSSHILNENVKTLRKQGLSEAEAMQKARDFLMSQ
jgi:hypothetical protein